MKSDSGWSWRGHLATVGAGATALGVATVGMETETILSLRNALVATGALGAAALIGGLVLAPVFRGLAGRERRLAEASARFDEIETRRTRESEVALPALPPLEIPETPPEDGLDEALSDLSAALQDEERLRERRRAAEPRVRAALEHGQDLGGPLPDDLRGISRLPRLIAELGPAVRAVRERSDDSLQQTAATGEVSALLTGHARTNRDSCVVAGRGVDELARHFDAVNERARRLESSTREIGQVLHVLNDITEQTSLLALNAAIIAAQAGEEGKGFGVVADEMRNLSERASSSTKETELLAQSLRDDVSRTVKNLGDASDVIRGLRTALAEASEAASLLTELGEKAEQSAQESGSAAERQADDVHELSGKVHLLEEERTKLIRFDREILHPTRQALEELTALLEDQWQNVAVRESLRRRLEAAVQAIRQRRGNDREERRALEDRLRTFQESSRRWASVIEEGRRRDDLVRGVARDIRELAGVSSRR